MAITFPNDEIRFDITRKCSRTPICGCVQLHVQTDLDVHEHMHLSLHALHDRA